MKADSIMPDLGQTNVLVVGDVMLDQYWFGAVERISPEAPVPIVSVNRGDKRGGGAANVALNVVSLGAKCTLLSVVGEDHYADDLEKMLLDAGINVTFVRDPDYNTTIKQRVISRNQQLIRLDFEQKPSPGLLSDCFDRYVGLMDSADSIILSDYGKGCLEQVSDMIDRAGQSGTPVAVDPKGRDYSRYRKANLITPNLNEFEHVVGDIKDDQQMDEKARQLVADLDIEHLLITLSEKGMKLFTHDNQIYYSPARAREVYDVSGAGDTVIACLGTMLTSGLHMTEILEIANAAAGVVVAKLGTAVASGDEIRHALMRVKEQS